MNLNRRRNRKSIVERCIVAVLSLCASAALMSSSALAQTNDKTIIDARDALKAKDRPRLVAARSAALAQQHPLAQWADYWELSDRLNDARPEELSAFFARDRTQATARQLFLFSIIYLPLLLTALVVDRLWL